MTKIMVCHCKHEYQDKLYGQGMRVFNYGFHCHNKGAGWRCTVCLSTRQADIKEIKK